MSVCVLLSFNIRFCLFYFFYKLNQSMLVCTQMCIATSNLLNGQIKINFCSVYQIKLAAGHHNIRSHQLYMGVIDGLYHGYTSE